MIDAGTCNAEFFSEFVKFEELILPAWWVHRLHERWGCGGVGCVINIVKVLKMSLTILLYRFYVDEICSLNVINYSAYIDI